MKVGVFFGSRSPEHDVSIITGTMIIKTLKELGHEVIPVYLTKEGIWLIDDALGDINFFKQENYQEKLKQFEDFYLDLTKSQGKMVFSKKKLFSQKDVEIDVAFPAFHGSNGEDGTIQGLFELVNIPYVGCDVLSSAITMDKVVTKTFYQRFNIPTTNFIYFSEHEWEDKADQIKENIKNALRWPVFIKPARLGSSIGMAKARNDEELQFAIEVALHYDNKVLVEESVEDLMDLTIVIMGNEELTASLIQESAYTKDFFSYEDKYLKEGGAQIGNATKNIIIPATLDEKTTNEVKEMALEIYKLIGCSGISRVDFLYDKTFKKIYASEVNTLPGTLYHHLWKASGVSLPDLLKKLIDLGIEKHTQKNKLTSTFQSDILKKSGTKTKLVVD